MTIERAHQGHADGICDLFVRADVPCFCQYYQFSGDHRDWQNRCANDRAENRARLVAELKEESLHAWVARREETVVGWTRVRPPEQMKKTYEGRLYRGLPCFSGEREGIVTLSCFLVDPEVRRQEVARNLLDAAITWARSQNLRAIEALPRGATDVSDGEQWMGPRSLYDRAGFALVHDFAPYPVLRLSL